MPIRNLLLKFGDRPNTHVNNEVVQFQLLEADSTASISPVRRNAGGGLRTVAFKVEVSAFISQNQYGSGGMNLDLDNIARAEVNEIAVLLAALPGQAAAGQQAWRFTITNSLDRWASCEITTVEFRPRLNVRCGCLLSASSLGTSGVIADPTHVAQDLDYDFPPVEAGT